MTTEASGRAVAGSSVPEWFQCALARLEPLLRGGDDPLSVRLSRIGARAARMNGAHSFSDGLCAPIATPSVALLEALRADYGVALADPRLVPLGDAALALYLQMRVQDDMVDEPQMLDVGYVYVGTVLAERSQRAFAESLGTDPLFFAFRERTLTAFARTATWELDVVRPGLGRGPDHVERLGQKFLPVAVPLGAMALLADRPEHLDTLTAFVTSLGIGLQIVNDILNVGEDHAACRLTPVLDMLRAGGRAAPPETPGRMRALLLSDSGLPWMLERARRAIDGAEEIARSIGATGMAAVASERARYVDTVPDRLLALLLRAGADA
jgi:hypothetical protein